MKNPFEQYKFAIEMLPFFHEVDYRKSPVHEGDRKFLNLVEAKTGRNIEAANRAVLAQLEALKGLLASAEMPKAVAAAFGAMKRLLLDFSIPVEELARPEGEYRRAWADILAYCHGVGGGSGDAVGAALQALERLVAARDLLADMGDYALGLYEERIQTANHRAVRYWAERKRAWTEHLHACERDYFAALHSLPLAVPKEAEERLLALLGDASSPYYNDGDRAVHEAAVAEAREIMQNQTEEELELPLATCEVQFASERGAPVAFRLPVCFSRREPLFVVCDAEAQESPLRVLLNTLLGQFLRGTVPGEAEIDVVDPVFNGDFVTKFQNGLATEKKNARQAARIGVEAGRDSGILKEFLKEYVSEKVTRTLQTLGDQFGFVEEFNAVNRAMPIARKLLVVNGLDNFVRLGSMNASMDLQQLCFLLKNAARCGIFVVMTGGAEYCQALRQELGASSDCLKVIHLATSAEGGLAEDGKAFLEFGHPGFSLGAGLTLLETPEQALRDLCTVVREIAGSIDQSVSLSDILPSDGGGLFSCAAYNRLRVPFGKNARGEIATWYCDKDVAGHTLIIGGTGSGKSNLMHSLITSACYLHRPDQFQLFLVDLKKGVEFKRYADARLPHARIIGIEGDPEMAAGVLETVYNLYTRHLELMKRHDAENLETLWERGGRAPRITLVIDEFQLLFESEATKPKASRYLEKIIKEGRAAGVNVILATQNPANVPSGIKDNVTTRIVMKNKREIFTEVAGFQFKDFCDQVTLPGEFLMLESGAPVLGRAALIKRDYQDALLREIADQVRKEHIPLDDETLVYDGTRFPTGESRVFRRTLERAGMQKAPTFVLGEDNSLTRAVFCSLGAEAGENLLIAGNHGRQMDASMDIFADLSSGASATEVQCSTALYWTLAHSLNQQAASGTEISLYDQKEYLSPFLASSEAIHRLASQRALGNRILELHRLVQARDQEGAPCTERKILVLLNAQTLSCLKEFTPQEAPPSPPPSAPPRPAAAGGGSSLTASLLRTGVARMPSAPLSRHAPAQAVTASKALQYLLQFGPQYNVFIVMAVNNVGILLRDVMERGAGIRTLFHHIVCLQMSDDDLAVQLGIRSLYLSDLGPRHAFYANELVSPRPQRFRPYYGG